MAKRTGNKNLTAAERKEQAAQKQKEQKKKGGPGLFNQLKGAIFGEAQKEVVQKPTV